mgnify:CR=1 FL=1
MFWHMWHLRIVHPEELIPFSRESSFTRNEEICNCSNCSAPTAGPQMSTAWHTDTVLSRASASSHRGLLYFSSCVFASRPDHGRDPVAQLWQLETVDAQLPQLPMPTLRIVSAISRLYQGYINDIPRIYQGYTKDINDAVRCKRIVSAPSILEGSTSACGQWPQKRLKINEMVQDYLIQMKFIEIP